VVREKLGRNSEGQSLLSKVILEWEILTLLRERGGLRKLGRFQEGNKRARLLCRSLSSDCKKREKRGTAVCVQLRLLLGRYLKSQETLSGKA